MTETVREAPAPPAPPAPGSTRFRTAFGGLLLLMLLASLDQTIVATALPTVVTDLGGLGDVSLVVTGYLVASIAATPVLGKLGDLFGRGRLLGVATVVFLGGSVLCGLATSLGLLVAFRAVQGVGAGGMMALAMAGVGDLVPARERGRYQGWIQSVFALASVAGPLAGGLLVETVGWRWIFLVNVPIGLVALIALRDLLRAKHTAGWTVSVDYLGAALLVAAVSSGVLVTAWGGVRMPWASAPILALIAVAAVCTVAFVWWETRASQPILPPSLLRNPVVAIAGATMFLTALGFFAAIVYVPVFVQVVVGSSATTAGLALLPLTLGVLAATTVSGRVIARTGRYKVFPIVGLAAMTAATALLATMGTSTGLVAVGLYMALLGLGFGCVTQVLVLAVQNSVDRTRLGTATASTNFFRGLGGALGVAVFGAILSAHVGGAAGPESASAVSDGLGRIFLTAVPLLAAALVAVCFLPERPLESGPVKG